MRVAEAAGIAARVIASRAAAPNRDDPPFATTNAANRRPGTITTKLMKPEALPAWVSARSSPTPSSTNP